MLQLKNLIFKEISEPIFAILEHCGFNAEREQVSTKSMKESG